MLTKNIVFGVLKSPYFDAFGSNLPERCDKNGKAIYSNEDKKIFRIIRIAGYIPVVGTVAGIARLISGGVVLCLFHQDKKAAEKNQNENEKEEAELIKKIAISLIARGAFEATSLGFLLLVPDLILTNWREKKLHETTQTAPPIVAHPVL
jgi:hypothetical protein